MSNNWDYVRRQFYLSVPSYIVKALLQLDHPQPKKRQGSPHAHMPVKYGAKKQYAAKSDGTLFLNKYGKLFIQQTSGKLLYLGRGVDPTILTAPSIIVLQQSNLTTDTLRKTHQMLDYVATQEEAIVTDSASNVVLAVYSDASYLSELNTRSQARGLFFLSSNTVHPLNNRAILTVAQIIKDVISSAA